MRKILILLLIVLISCTAENRKIEKQDSISELTMELTSPAFGNNEKIPVKFTCDGENISPTLKISGVPKGAKSLVLIMDDPDIPEDVKKNFNIEVWDHWVVFNILPTVKEIKENQQPEGIRGINTRQELGYKGPCPHDKEHRYFFKLYALDTILDLEEGSTKKQVENAMQEHILAQAVLIGKYERQ